MNKKLSLLAAILILATSVTAHAHDSIPGTPQDHPIALVGGTVFPVSGKPIEGGTVLFDGGKIVAVGADVKLPEGTETIDVTGKHVYPGLFDAHSNLGLIEIPSIRASVDARESGTINPNVEAIKAVHPDSELIPVTRRNGVLLALTAPGGPLLAGRSSVIQLDGWTWEEMALKIDVAMHLSWPLLTPVRDWRNHVPAAKQAERRDELLRELKRALDDAAAYKTAREAGKDDPRFAIDARWEALMPVLAGKQPLIVYADDWQQIESAVALADSRKLRIILHGGHDAERCAALLKERSIPVILEGTYRLPIRSDEEYDAPFTLAERLRAAGLKFCIAGGGQHATENVRNLPYHAAQSVAFGLPPDEALRAITLSPADILGVADRVGSLEAGKDATLFVADGDILDTASHVEQAWIGGRAVDLTDRQTRLWKKYQQKYRPRP
jgi:imidazolonepropionase-like amidohydrolase